MPDDMDDNNQPLASSDSGALDDDFDVRGEGPDNGTNGADSSDAHGVADEARSTIDVIQDVVTQRGDGAGSPPDGQKEGEAADPTATQEGAAKDPEDYSDVPFHKHPRFQQLLSEKKANQADAEQFRGIRSFLTTNAIREEDAANWLTLYAQMKGDPQAAWTAIKPIIQQLLIDAGEVLPADLQQRVERGELSADAANEIAKERAKASSLTRRTETVEQQRQREEQERLIDGLRTAANTWEADRVKRDPNFAAKKPLILKELTWLQAKEGKPNTPDGVRAQLKAAYDEVNKTFRAPARAQAPSVGQAVRQQRPSGSGASQPRRPANEPAGAMKFIDAVVAQRGAA